MFAGVGGMAAAVAAAGSALVLRLAATSTIGVPRAGSMAPDVEGAGGERCRPTRKSRQAEAGPRRRSPAPGHLFDEAARALVTRGRSRTTGPCGARARPLTWPRGRRRRESRSTGGVALPEPGRSSGRQRRPVSSAETIVSGRGVWQRSAADGGRRRRPCRGRWPPRATGRVGLTRVAAAAGQHRRPGLRGRTEAGGLTVTGDGETEWAARASRCRTSRSSGVGSMEGVRRRLVVTAPGRPYVARSAAPALEIDVDDPRPRPARSRSARPEGVSSGVTPPSRRQTSLGGRASPSAVQFTRAAPRAWCSRTCA